MEMQTKDEQQLVRRSETLSRFIKSYKYKHKRKRRELYENINMTRRRRRKFASCDQVSTSVQYIDFRCDDRHKTAKEKTTCDRFSWEAEVAHWATQPSDTRLPAKTKLINDNSNNLLMKIPILILILFSLMPITANAFCPIKCQCDDQSLSANCTQVPSISSIPMTFNPLLKQLTLNQLPVVELSNSLSVYRQLEYLNLNSNQLRQIKYQNFNFKPPQTSILLAQHHDSLSPTNHNVIAQSFNGNDRQQQDPFELTNLQNEQIARSFKQAIDKSLGSSSSTSQLPGSTISGSATGSSSSSSSVSSSASDDEIRFHLRELELADNRIDQLGSGELGEELGELSLDSGQEELVASTTQAPTSGLYSAPSVKTGGKRRIRPTELERQSPFLTLTRLESLNLARNRLYRLQEHAFLGLVQLKRLDLSRNQLESIDKHAFVGLISLELLKLNSNKLARHLQPLSLAFCRAPMMELRSLDLSDNSRQEQTGSDTTATSISILLPNQMFMCSPRLLSLSLSNLQLRYIQVNAFDNLQQLESLNLSGNFFEQVPSDSFSYSNSNLSSTLRQLDLSGTLIEFVNARSFSSLRNLQRLSMSRMQRLVSFDLAALSIRNRIIQAPSSLASGNNYFADSSQSGPMVFHHQNPQGQLINDQLVELQLRHNPRLQALRSSLASRLDEPKGRIRFTRLRLLDLHGASELRDLPLEEMIDSHQAQMSANGDETFDSDTIRLKVDLSFANKFNCSACQMSWLVEAAKLQRTQLMAQSLLGGQQQQLPAQWPGHQFPVNFGPFDPFAAPQAPATSKQESVFSSRIQLIGGHLIGCSWPFAMPLMQLIDLDSSFAPIFGHQNCHRPPMDAPMKTDESSGVRDMITSGQNGPLVVGSVHLSPHQTAIDHHRNASRTQQTADGLQWSPILLALLLTLLLVSVGVKLTLGWISGRRRCIPGAEFKWLTAGGGSLVGTSGSLPNSSPSSSSQRTDCPILCHNPNSSANGQDQRQQQADNLVYYPNRKQQLYSRMLPTGHVAHHFASSSLDPNSSIRNNNSNSINGRQIGKVQGGEQRGNLFSRIAGRLSGRSKGDKAGLRALGSPMMADLSATGAGLVAEKLRYNFETLDGRPKMDLGQLYGDKTVLHCSIDPSSSTPRAGPMLRNLANQVAAPGASGLQQAEDYGNIRPLVKGFNQHLGSAAIDTCNEQLNVRGELVYGQQQSSYLRRAPSGVRDSQATCGGRWPQVEQQQTAVEQGNFEPLVVSEQNGQLYGRQLEYGLYYLAEGGGELAADRNSAAEVAAGFEGGGRSGSQLLVDGHIYVTLDGPIKQTTGCRSNEYTTLQARDGQPKQQQEEQQGNLVQFSRQNCASGQRLQSGDYKSSEWSQEAEVAAAPASGMSRELQSAASRNPLEKTMKPEEEEEESYFKLAAKLSSSSSSEKRRTKRSAADGSEQNCDSAADRKSAAARQKRPPKRNVTGQPDCDKKPRGQQQLNGQHKSRQQQLFMAPDSEVETNNELGERLTGCLNDVTGQTATKQQLNWQRPEGNGDRNGLSGQPKYDANHATLQIDHNISTDQKLGLAPSDSHRTDHRSPKLNQMPAAALSNAKTRLDNSSHDGVINGLRQPDERREILSMGVANAGQRADLIAQRDSTDLSHLNGQQNISYHQNEMTKGATDQSNREIYSNQFYYCKPTDTNTTNRTLLRGGKSSISMTTAERDKV